MDSLLALGTTTLGLGAGGGVGFFFVKWLFEFFGGRMDKQADRLDAGTNLLITQLQGQVTALLEREKHREERLRVVEDELAECKRRHAESDAEVHRLKAIMQGRGEMRERAAVIVAAEKLEERRQEKKS
ncbi:hypothetical protein [Pelagerythrobacter aerophilus]|uniref:Uncharacterized protein n=1 Tax=Pelagerythrobacter aerophilus TaxID=2306995 RepID=A0A418NJT0_9SPHN|nr:hypothetical protein [Pelagerythrobacter aerophilus]RIV79588.1 hypothetical protein D2V04_06355 [Pelagerythrobacter aerophilus]